MKTEIKVLENYTRSTLFGSYIRDILVFDDEKIIINNEKGDKQEFYFIAKDLGVDSLLDVSVDYLLCLVQDDLNIKVKKY